jgi:hypothetical protein
MCASGNCAGERCCPAGCPECDASGCLDGCGDADLDAGEQCDWGAAANGTACTPPVGGTCEYCDANCQLAEVVYFYPCDSSHADCDGSADNGCETGLGTDAHCADCTDACAGGETCESGVCTRAGTCSDGVRNQEETGVDCGGSCSPCPAYVRAFYVSSSDPNRSDSNDGTSPLSPWETLERVNAEALGTGDAVFFKRGDVFRGTLISSGAGTPEDRIFFSAYGEGARPLILGSKDLSSPGAWTLVGDNLWKTSAGVSESGFMGNLVFDDEAACGVRKTTPDDCRVQGDFFLDEGGGGDGSITLCSEGNPGERYSRIEAGGVFSENVVSLEAASYVTLSNLDVRYSANNGIFLWHTDHVIVEDCSVSWIGGMYYGGGPVRMGNGIQMWTDNSNIVLRYNKIDQIYDAGISPQGGGTYTQENIHMYHNLISNCWYSYEVFTYPGSTLDNVVFDNNTCVGAGNQWSADQRPDTENARHVINWSGGGTVINCSIRNNIFKDSTNTAYRFGDEVEFDLDYNLYDVATLGVVASSTCTMLEEWQSRTSRDSHSLSGGPEFVSPSDFHLQASSPAIDHGTDVGLTRDYDGNPIGDIPDIGAYEVQ